MAIGDEAPAPGSLLDLERTKQKSVSIQYPIAFVAV